MTAKRTWLRGVLKSAKRSRSDCSLAPRTCSCAEADPCYNARSSSTLMFPQQARSGIVPAAVSAAAFSERTTSDPRLLPFVARGRCRGFTLLELLIVVGIIAVLLVLIAPAFTTIKGAGRRHQRRIHDQGRARHRPHLRESKQHLHMGRILQDRLDPTSRETSQLVDCSFKRWN